MQPINASPFVQKFTLAISWKENLPELAQGDSVRACPRSQSAKTPDEKLSLHRVQRTGGVQAERQRHPSAGNVPRRPGTEVSTSAPEMSYSSTWRRISSKV